MEFFVLSHNSYQAGHVVDKEHVWLLVKDLVLVGLGQVNYTSSLYINTIKYNITKLEAHFTTDIQLVHYIIAVGLPPSSIESTVGY